MYICDYFLDLESSLAILVGTNNGDLYLVGCPTGSSNLYAVGPLERPSQPLLLGANNEINAIIRVKHYVVCCML